MSTRTPDGDPAITADSDPETPDGAAAPVPVAGSPAAARRARVSGVLSTEGDPSTIPEDEVAEDVAETALLIGTLFRRMFSFGDGGSALRLMDEYDLGFPEFKTMLELGAADRPTDPCMQDIAEAVGASLPSISRAVDSLVRKDLVLRAEDPVDRRRRILALTAEGREVVHRILLGRAAGAIRLAAGFTPEERTELNAVLGRIVRREDLARIYDQLDRAVVLDDRPGNGGETGQ